MFLHLLTPTVLKSLSTPSNHLNLGLPTLRLPPGLSPNILLPPLSLSVLCIWPSHSILSLYIVETESEVLNILFLHWFSFSTHYLYILGHIFYVKSFFPYC
jgi:hypothetical protein